MARLPRYIIHGQPLHIIQHDNNRQMIFALDEDYQFFRVAQSFLPSGLTERNYISAFWRKWGGRP
jgi:hypothetical protein